VATKDHRKQARGLIEGLESRVHLGPPIRAAEITSARQFLLQSDFSPASDYFGRLAQVQDRLETRSNEAPLLPGKRNYGGEAAGYWMQLQSAYDHIILSICYEGEFNLRRGRIKISHRFNQAGRVDFVELKFLRALDPILDGAIRKLILVKDYAGIRRDWHEAAAFVLEVLPRELIFLFEEIFRTEKSELLAWLMNIGHRQAGDLLQDIISRPPNGHVSGQERNLEQLCIEAVRTDEVAMPILERAAALEAVVEPRDARTVVARYR
jgi:hypothetical protein